MESDYRPEPTSQSGWKPFLESVKITQTRTWNKDQLLVHPISLPNFIDKEIIFLNQIKFFFEY